MAVKTKGRRIALHQSRTKAGVDQGGGEGGAGKAGARRFERIAAHDGRSMAIQDVERRDSDRRATYRAALPAYPRRRNEPPPADQAG